MDVRYHATVIMFFICSCFSLNAEEVDLPFAHLASCFPNIEERETSVSKLVKQYPDLLTEIPVGKSYLSSTQNIMLYKLSAGQSLKTSKVFYLSGVHGNELGAYNLSFHFLRDLLVQYSRDPLITKMLDSTEVYFLLHANPDAIHLSESKIVRSRNNLNDSYCKVPEGSIGVDLNRNFEFDWNISALPDVNEACSHGYVGPSAASETETQAVVEALAKAFANNNASALFVDIHSTASAVIYPDSSLLSDDKVSSSNAIATRLAEIGGTPFMSMAGSELYTADGTSASHVVGTYGIPSVTIEIKANTSDYCDSYIEDIYPSTKRQLLEAMKISANLDLVETLSKVDIRKPQKNEQGDLTIPVLVKDGVESDVFVIARFSSYKLQKELNVGDAKNKDLVFEASELPAGSFQLDIVIENRKTDSQLLINSYDILKTDNLLVRSGPSIDKKCDEILCTVSVQNEHGSLLEGASLKWHSIDNTIGDGSYVEISRNEVGLKQLWLDISYDDGLSSSTEVLINTNKTRPNPAISIQHECKNLVCNLSVSDELDEDTESFRWFTDDQREFEGKEITIQYEKSGSYMVTVVASNPIGLRSFGTAILNVSDSPVVEEPPSTPDDGKQPSGGGVLWLNIFLLLFVLHRLSSKLK